MNLKTVLKILLWRILMCNEIGLSLNYKIGGFRRLNFENTEVWGFEHALRGMRNAMESWNKSDSGICKGGDNGIGCDNCATKEECKHSYDKEFKIGKNDMKLAQTLVKAGNEHRKFMRQIFVSVDITAPLYWWKEFDTYKVGTVANSTSTMHKLATTPITLDCFETDDYDRNLSLTDNPDDDGLDNISTFEEDIIYVLENLRQKYLETKDKRYWKELIRWLPESWLQKRTVTMTYENVLAMCSKGQRRFHKLNEWSGLDNPNVQNFIAWARSLPYAQKLIFIDELDKE